MKWLIIKSFSEMKMGEEVEEMIIQVTIINHWLSVTNCVIKLKDV